MARYKKSLFIFRRDLRLTDNTALNAALQNSTKVIPCFIFDPRQISSSNDYYSQNAAHFMVESLQNLEEQLQKHKAQLYYFHGIAEDVVERLLHTESLDAVYLNKNYTPFSLKRDAALEKKCRHAGRNFHAYDDLLLHPPELIKTANGDPFSIFTPFYKKALTVLVAHPQKLAGAHFYATAIAHQKIFHHDNFLKQANTTSIAVHGGSTQALAILSSLKKFRNYHQEHDVVSHATTRLSAHNKFGTISIRSVYHAINTMLGINHPLIRQLYWRDFFTTTAYYSPFVFGAPFKEKYKDLTWSDNASSFKRWCTGTTGFPIVDAGMRELNTTGFMHNRSRLITASFLVKDLHINWLWGEKYFAQQLVDYDPCVNNGNWQWVASTGCDAQPYFRIFNPWLQQKKFDPHCIYVKKWIPELRSVENSDIHTWYKKKITLKNYPHPMIDHEQEAQIAKSLYQKVKSN